MTYTPEELKAQGKMQDPVTGQVFDLPVAPQPQIQSQPQQQNPQVQPQIRQSVQNQVQPSQISQPTNNYIVQAGDSITQIADKLGVSPQSISGYRSGNPNLIYPGETLTIGQQQNQQQQNQGASSQPQTEEPASITPDFQSSIDALMAKYGITAPSSDQSPTTTFADTYKQLYQNLGLEDVKNRITSTTSQIQEINDELAQKEQEINNNPWLTEGIRVRRIESERNKYEAKKNNLVNRLTLEQSLFDKGQEEAKFVAEQALEQSQYGQTLARDTFFKVIDQVQKEEEAKRKLTEFSPSNYKEIQGGLYDVQNQKWIVQPKTTTDEDRIKQLQIEKLEKDLKAGTTQEVSPYQVERASRTIQSVDELLPKVNSGTVGLGAIASFIPETSAANFKAELDTLKSNIAFGELTAMREASKTGGALGQVSDVEGRLLQASLGALDTNQSPENFKIQLQKIKDSILRWQNAVNSSSASSTDADPLGLNL